MANETGFNLTQSKLTYIGGLVGLAMIGINLFSSYQANAAADLKHEIEQDQRLDRTDRNREMFKEQLTTLNSKLEETNKGQVELREAIVKLTAVIEARPKK